MRLKTTVELNFLPTRVADALDLPHNIFLASDASANTKKMITDKAKFYNVTVDDTYSSYELSSAIGQDNRMVIGITSAGFLKILKK